MYNWVIDDIQNKLKANGGAVDIPMLTGNKTFKATLCEGGVEVDNLRNQPFLEWKVFEKAVQLLESQCGTANKGVAKGAKLGEEKLDLKTIEGYVAKEVYNKEIGESVIRRITPICNILIWAGICENLKGGLRLIK